MKTKTVRELGGEVWAEIVREQTRINDSCLREVDTAVTNKLVDLVTAVLARHIDVTIKQDENLPVQPLPVIRPDD